MKYSIAFVASAALVAAQIPTDIAACGQLCIGNMIGEASTFGCSSTDIGCLCADPRFGYGLRDCTNEACGSEVFPQVAAYASSVCADAGVTAGGAGAGTAISTGASGIAGSSVPITTSEILTTISSDGSAVATSTVGSTTLFSIVGAAGGAAGSLSGSASEAAASSSAADSSAAADASSLAESASGAASSAAGSASDALTSATGAAGSAAGSASSAAESATATGLAPVITAAPILGGAALAALLML